MVRVPKEARIVKVPRKSRSVNITGAFRVIRVSEVAIVARARRPKAGDIYWGLRPCKDCS